ncbi:unnamed protein product [Caenorhabditis angaria]|uniref:Uncharacterized protein n=1 Tax=Caenorhabditis angaria TaxID=860376 RepID=A0A9P1II56_9PELO|nr:unnamed protein product [Caenorhabditis angaria]
MKFLLILLISQVSSTIITVKGTIRCNLYSTFNATIKLLEKDVAFSDVIKTKEWINKPSNVAHNFSIKGNFTGGDGVLDNEYEPAIQIESTCSDITWVNGEQLVGNVVRELKSVPITAASANYTGLSFKLDNKFDI